MNALRVSAAIIWVTAAVSVAALAQSAMGLYTDSDPVGDNTFATASCFSGDTGFLSPSAQAADTGGDGNGFESSPTNAFADDVAYASNINGRDDRHRYYNYGISLASGCNVTGIEVRLDWWLDSTSQSNTMSVELSWDGGTSWTAAKTDSTETITEHIAVLGGTADSWAHTWTLAQLSDANFRLRIESGCSGQPAGCNTRDYFLDWVPVKAHYAP